MSAPPLGRLVPAPADAPAYPVAVGDVVALGLAANPVGEITCPVGEVTAVDPAGVSLRLFRWLPGTFDLPAWVAWPRVLEIRWAERDGDGVFVMDPLADYQTRWTRGAEYLREQGAPR